MERVRDGEQAVGDLFIYFLTCCNKNGSKHHRPWKESSQSFPAHTHPHTCIHTDPFIRDTHTKWIHRAHGKKAAQYFFLLHMDFHKQHVDWKDMRENKTLRIRANDASNYERLWEIFYVESLFFEFGSLLYCFSHKHSIEFVNLSLKKVKSVLSTHLLLVIKWHYELTNAETGYSTEVSLNGRHRAEVMEGGSGGGGGRSLLKVPRDKSLMSQGTVWGRWIFDSGFGALSKILIRDNFQLNGISTRVGSSCKWNLKFLLAGVTPHTVGPLWNQWLFLGLPYCDDER